VYYKYNVTRSDFSFRYKIERCMKRQILKKSTARGFLIGVVINIVIPAAILVEQFDGRCGIDIGLSGSRSCTLAEAMVSLDGLGLYYIWWFVFTWWAIFIFILSILGTYLYYRKK
jgi:hypothetical protein